MHRRLPMPERNHSHSRVLNIPPKFLAGLFIVVIGLFSGTALYQYHSRKAELEHLLHEESSILIHALTDGTENALLGYRENSSLVTGGLVDQLRLIERMDRRKPLTSAELTEIAGGNSMYRITVIDRNGKRIAWNTPPDHTPEFQTCNPAAILEPLLTGKTDILNLGLRESTSGRGPRLVVAVARSRGGAIVGNVDASRLVNLRKQLGPGRLIQRIGANNSAIDYIIWQDSTAIISATPNVTDASSMQDDPTLSKAQRQNRTIARTINFNGRKVYEIINPFIFQGNEMGVLRIGMKTDHIDEATNRLRTRLIMLLTLALLGVVAVISLMVSRRNEALISTAYQREQRFSAAILENMADAVISIDPSGRITLLNRAAEQLFSIEGQDVTGQNIGDIVPECGRIFMELTGSATSIINREFNCTVNDHTLVIAGNFSPLPEIDADRSNGRGASKRSDIAGAMAVLRDVTEQRLMQRIIERQEKLSAMGELASGVAHEIRNPLNAIGVLGQRLDIEFTPTGSEEEEYHHLVRSIVSEVRRVDSIIRRFLKFARPPQLVLFDTALDSWLQEYRPVLEGEAETKGIHLIMQCHASCSLPVDREQLQQVLFNLVRNAVEASPHGSTITLSTGKSADRAFIKVKDSGHGIDEGTLSKIFNLYFTTKKDGTGMGLSIANQIVQAHGGMIEVDSQPGYGSRFTIVLPLS